MAVKLTPIFIEKAKPLKQRELDPETGQRVGPRTGLPERTEIGFDVEADKRRFHVTESGIVIVVRQESLIEEPETA